MYTIIKDGNKVSLHTTSADIHIIVVKSTSTDERQLVI